MSWIRGYGREFRQLITASSWELCNFLFKEHFKEQSAPIFQVRDKYFSHCTAEGAEAQKQAIFPRVTGSEGQSGEESSDLAQSIKSFSWTIFSWAWAEDFSKKSGFHGKEKKKKNRVLRDSSGLRFQENISSEPVRAPVQMKSDQNRHHLGSTGNDPEKIQLVSRCNLKGPSWET